MTASSGSGPDFSLRGRRAVITGASQNIGAAIAAAFAMAGADVLLVARRKEPLEATGAALRARAGSRVLTVAADVADPAAPAQIMAAAAEFDGPVDILVNNAYATGDTYGTSIFETGDAAWETALQANVMGPMRLARSFGAAMIAAGGGSIINVLTGSAFLPTPTLGPYGASKAALWTMTRYLAAEGAPAVRANAICPGVIGRAGEQLTPTQRELLAQVPAGRPGRPEEVAGAAVYLASDAASYTTGEVIFVNGGRPW
jgi:NAD(P)-dependent dehydrogenase (short-subunit alcohol dehydrogenase family)